MSDVVIRAEGLGKKFVIGHAATGQRGGYQTLRESVTHRLKGLFRPKGSAPATTEEFWALKDINFEIKRGEAVGIIGRNGAGKSTLLKVLSRITEPTEGRVTIKGRVASLLEVGTGFHAELTGRENIFLNGAILGMTRAEIRKKFDEIVDFAGVERFVDTPVKRYSSGMYVRLAFSVASQLEPEILVIDEVLAVGDSEFQNKCLGKMEDVTKTGRTVLFVSHNLSAVQSLCSQGIVLDRGSLCLKGPLQDAIPYYMQSSQARINFKSTRSSNNSIKEAILLPPTQDRPDHFGLEVLIQVEHSCSLALDIIVSDLLSTPVGYGSLGAIAPTGLLRLHPGLNRVITEHDISMLANGAFNISLDLTRPNVEYVDRLDNCLTFEHSAPSREPNGARLTLAWNKGAWELPTKLLELKANDQIYS